MSTRVAYIGLDHHHRDPYLTIAASLPVDIVAVCEPGEDVDPSTLTALSDRPDEITTEGTDIAAMVADATAYSDPETLFAEADVDVVWITYSNDAVPGIVAAAVEAGVDVISEKPLARTAADLEPVATAATDRGVTVAPSYFYRRNPVAMDLHDWVTEGFFGDIWSVDGRFVGSQLGYRDTDHYIYDAARSRGGALQWIGLHWMDMMMYILDEPITRVNAQRSDPDTVDVEDGMTLQFETASGVMGTFQTGYYLSDRGKDTHLGLYGTDAQAWTPVHDNAHTGPGAVPLQVFASHDDWTGAPKRTTQYELGYDRFPAWGDFVRDYFAAFFAGRESGDVPADVHDALRMLRVLDAAYVSAESDRWVTV
ncbi:MAG: Gfo/Idh/MocA family oxidoreductase [Halobacteriales archaeon]|nr:Gfo/Idh/MocA family oxidoreductase [Halobacteriales archaeon]